MSKRHKDFGSPIANKDLEPVSFDLYDETFECQKAIQGATLLAFMREADSGQGGRAADALLGFFERVLKKESFGRFEELWNDSDRIVSMDTLSEIVAWLVEVYTERPTPASSKS